MAILTAPNMLGRTGSMGDRRPLGRRRSGFDRHSSTSSSRGDQRCRHGRACGTIILAVLIGAIICSPYILLGPNVILSVSVRTAVLLYFMTCKGCFSLGVLHSGLFLNPLSQRRLHHFGLPKNNNNYLFAYYSAKRTTSLLQEHRHTPTPIQP